MAEKFGSPEVILADGTTMSADVAVAGDALWLYIRDREDPYNSLGRLGNKLSNPEALGEIPRLMYGKSTVYAGFTRLTNVKFYEPGMVCARLQKEVAADVQV